MASDAVRQRKAPGYLLIILPIVIGIVTLIISFVSYPRFHEEIRGLGLRDVTRLFTPEYWVTITDRLRVFAAVWFLLGAVLAVRHRAVAAFADRLFASFAAFGSDVAARARALAREDRGYLVALAILTVVALLVRIAFVNQPLRADEAFTYLHYSTPPLYIGLTTYFEPNNHPLETFLLRVVARTIGDAPWALRFPTLIAGVLIVPLAYLFARTFYNRHAAIVTAAIAASSHALTLYATNARGYAYVAVFFLATFLLARYLTRTRSLAAWTLFALSTALGFYAIPIMLYAFGVVAVWYGLTILVEPVAAPRKVLVRDAILGFSAAAALTLVLYSPILLVSGIGAVTDNDYVVSRGWREFLAGMRIHLRMQWEGWHTGMPPFAIPVLLLGAAIGVVFHRKIARDRVPIWAGVVLWIMPLLVVQRVSPWIRTWLFLFPVYVAIASAGLVWLAGRIADRVPAPARAPRVATISWLAVAIGIWGAVLVVGERTVLYSAETGVFRDAEPVTRFLRERLERPDVRVVTDEHSSSQLEYLFPRYGLDIDHLEFVDSRRLHLRSVAHLDTGEVFGDRFYIVLNLSRADTLDRIVDHLAKARVPLDGYAPPRLVGRFPETLVYEVLRAPRSARTVDADQPARAAGIF